MLRILIVLPLLVTIGTLAQADGSVVDPINAGLMQIQDCLNVQSGHLLAGKASPPGHAERGIAGLSVQALISTLAIGLLTLVCFVPVALLVEMLMRRDK